MHILTEKNAVYSYRNTQKKTSTECAYEREKKREKERGKGRAEFEATGRHYHEKTLTNGAVCLSLSLSLCVCVCVCVFVFVFVCVCLYACMLCTDARHGGIDIVYANAGVDGREFAARAAQGEPVFADDVMHAVMNVNVMGTLHTIGPALELMMKRGRGGQVAIVSSGTAMLTYGMELSGKSMPGAVPYLASKEAQSAVGRGLHYVYKAEGIDVRTIYPGYVESGITKENSHAMMKLMDADEAAHEIARQMAAPPGPAGAIVFPREHRISHLCLNLCIGLCGGARCVNMCFTQKSISDDLTVAAATAARGAENVATPAEWRPMPMPMEPPVVFTMGHEVAQTVNGEAVPISMSGSASHAS